MSVRLKLANGSEATIYDETFDKVVRDLQIALRDGGVLRMDQRDGRAVAVVPQAICVIEET